jgi:hypothetical protein
MAIPSALNRALDVAHKVTVGVLITSAVYFTLEIGRATWAISGHNAETRQQDKSAAAATPAADSS